MYAQQEDPFTQEAIDAVIDIAHRAGDILVRYFGTSLTRMVKSGPHDFATEADHASEQFVIEELQKLFPEDALLGEETGFHGSEEARFVWTIDPLDGTYNFAHNNERFGVMLTRIDEQLGEPIFAIIYNPKQELFAVAERGKGVLLNGKPVHLTFPSSLTELRPIIGKWENRKDAEYIERLAKFFEAQHISNTNFHSMAASVMAMLTEGYSVFSINSDYPWDYCPMYMIVREAGMTVTNFAGEAMRWREGQQSFLAAPPQLHDQLLAIACGTRHNTGTYI